jgi:sulfur relay (sulfurtransferase) DsrF/TusC family protein
MPTEPSASDTTLPASPYNADYLRALLLSDDIEERWTIVHHYLEEDNKMQEPAFRQALLTPDAFGETVLELAVRQLDAAVLLYVDNQLAQQLLQQNGSNMRADLHLLFTMMSRRLRQQKLATLMLRHEDKLLRTLDSELLTKLLDSRDTTGNNVLDELCKEAWAEHLAPERIIRRFYLHMIWAEIEVRTNTIAKLNQNDPLTRQLATDSVLKMGVRNAIKAFYIGLNIDLPSEGFKQSAIKLLKEPNEKRSTLEEWFCWEPNLTLTRHGESTMWDRC